MKSISNLRIACRFKYVHADSRPARFVEPPLEDIMAKKAKKAKKTAKKTAKKKTAKRKR